MDIYGYSHSHFGMMLRSETSACHPVISCVRPQQAWAKGGINRSWWLSHPSEKYESQLGWWNPFQTTNPIFYNIVLQDYIQNIHVMNMILLYKTLRIVMFWLQLGEDHDLGSNRSRVLQLQQANGMRQGSNSKTLDGDVLHHELVRILNRTYSRIYGWHDTFNLRALLDIFIR